MPTGEYHSKGKFLLTGEYLVLYGAKALAVPLKFGQRMSILDYSECGTIKWETFVKGNLWFDGTFDKNLDILNASDLVTAQFVQKLLKAGAGLQPAFNLENRGYHVINNIEFDISWGLGSSSSLVSNMAWWLNVDPYDLYRKLYRGSGYDVFCSRASNPIVYQLRGQVPEYREIPFKPSFSDDIYFVYLGRKQDSQKSVSAFKSKGSPDEKLVMAISELTEAIISAGSLDEFSHLLCNHEELLSSVLGLKRIKDEQFPDFPGEIKSLGAWGGDFAMAASHLGFNELKEYFSRKNLPVVFKWNEIIY